MYVFKLIARIKIKKFYSHEGVAKSVIDDTHDTKNRFDHIVNHIAH